ncbi:MAG TPA: hypothetical protein EYQ54_08760 [Myxococcales bacterium]|nr:hypothetical protein [Myxococcales bacterium]
MLLLTAATTAWIFRLAVADHLIASQLRELDLTPARFEIARIDAGAFELIGLQIGDGPDVEVGRIEMRYSAGELLKGRLDSLRIEGLRIRGSVGDRGLSLGALSPLLVGSEHEQPPSPAEVRGAELPILQLAIEDARIFLDTDFGPLEAVLSAEAVQSGDRQLGVEAELSATLPEARLHLGLNATGDFDVITGNLSLDLSAGGSWETITAQSLSISAQADFSIEGEEATLQPEGCVAIQLESMAVENVLTLMAPLHLCLQSASPAAIQRFKDGRMETAFELAATPFAAELSSADGEALHLSGELPRLRIKTRQLAEQFELWVESEAGHLEIPELALSIRGMALEATLPPHSTIPSGRLRIQEIIDTQSPARISPLSAEVDFKSGAEAIDFKAALTTPNRELTITASGRHNLAESVGQAEIQLLPIEFAPGNLQPEELFPILAGAMSEVSGKVWINSSGVWGSDQSYHQLEAFVSDFTATSELASIVQLNGAFSYRDHGIPQDQLISMDLLNFGIELKDGLIQYHVDPEGVVGIESASWKFAGGELRTQVRFDPGSSNQEITFQVEGIELAELTDLIALEGLSGFGKLDGKLPLFLSEEDIEIRGAVLRSREPGIIRYQAASSVASMEETFPQFSQTLEILKNLHYDELEVTINGIASGAVLIELHLAGKNPEYQDGRPVDFNLSLEEQSLPNLLRASRVTHQVPDAVQQKIDAGK